MKNNTLLIAAIGLAAFFFLQYNSSRNRVVPPPPPPQNRSESDLMKWARLVISITGATAATVRALWGPGGIFNQKNQIGLTQAEMQALMMAATA